MERERGWKTGRKGGGRCTGGGSRGGGKRDPQGGGKQEKKIKLQNTVQYCAIEKMQRREPTNAWWEPGLKGMGSGRFKPPVLPPLPTNVA